MDKTTRDAVIKWMGENPYELYAHYDDELPVELIAKLLDRDPEALNEYENELIDNNWMYVEWDNVRSDLISALNISDEVAESDDFDELFDECKSISTGDYIETVARNTRLHIVATPYIGAPGEYHFEEDQEDCLLLFPHGHLYEEENERRAKQLLDVLGVENPAEAETCYEFDTLKVMGSIDLADLIENGPPTHITFGPDDIDNIVTHNRVNGSGGCGTVRLTKTVTLPAMFRVDDGDSYGVDSVFGFVGEVWRRPLKAERKE